MGLSMKPAQRHSFCCHTRIERVCGRSDGLTSSHPQDGVCFRRSTANHHLGRLSPACVGRDVVRLWSFWGSSQPLLARRFLVPAGDALEHPNDASEARTDFSASNNMLIRHWNYQGTNLNKEKERHGNMLSTSLVRNNTYQLVWCLCIKKCADRAQTAAVRAVV